MTEETNLVLGHLRHIRSCVDGLADDMRQVILRLCAQDRHLSGLQISEFREPLGVCHGGVTLKSDTVNTLDVAVVRVSGVIVSDMAIQGRPIRDREDPYERSPHEYFYVAGGTTISCTRPERVLGTVSVEHQGRFLRYAGFWTLTTRGALPARGQSGAALCREEGGGLLISGIVFGGIPGSNKVWVYSASDVWQALFQ
jgi:hypothetical protein